MSDTRRRRKVSGGEGSDSELSETEAKPSTGVGFIQGGRDHWAVYYSTPQSLFLIKLTYSLA